MTAPLVRVFLVSDWILLRQGLIALLREIGGFAIVGDASDPESALHLAGFSVADVILLSLMQPGILVIEAIERITAARPGVPVLILSGSHSDEQLLEGIRAGAMGCLRPDAHPWDIAQAIRATHRGEAWLPPALAKRILQDIHRSGHGMPAADISRGEPLTNRESEVFRLLAEGLTNPSIAERLGVSEATIRTHVSHILAKLHVRTRVQAVLFALGQSVVGPCDPPSSRAQETSQPAAEGVLSEQPADSPVAKGF
jgi:two-component system, NarL family, response regulator LiaR